MALKLATTAASNQAASLSKDDTMVRVKVGHGTKFPELVKDGDWFPLAVANELGEIEYMKATSRVGDTIIVLRGQEGTEARDYTSGDPVFLPLTTAALSEIIGIAGPLSLSINDTVVTP